MRVTSAVVARQGAVLKWEGAAPILYDLWRSYTRVGNPCVVLTLELCCLPRVGTAGALTLQGSSFQVSAGPSQLAWASRVTVEPRRATRVSRRNLILATEPSVWLIITVSVRVY